MTSGQEALYRQVAAALEAKGVEPPLLDACPCQTAAKWARLGMACARCHGTGTVVPSEAEGFYRLTLANGGCDVERVTDQWWGYEGHINGTAKICEIGSGPLDARLRAVAAGLGLELLDVG